MKQNLTIHSQLNTSNVNCRFSSKASDTLFEKFRIKIQAAGKVVRSLTDGFVKNFLPVSQNPWLCKEQKDRRKYLHLFYTMLIFFLSFFHQVNSGQRPSWSTEQVGLIEQSSPPNQEIPSQGLWEIPAVSNNAVINVWTAIFL